MCANTTGGRILRRHFDILMLIQSCMYNVHVLNCHYYVNGFSQEPIMFVAFLDLIKNNLNQTKNLKNTAYTYISQLFYYIFCR